MKLKRSLIIPFFLSMPAAALAKPISSQEVHEKLKAISKQADHPTVFKGPNEIMATLPSEKLRGDEKQEWIYSFVTAFIRDGKMVDQIAIETQNCNVSEARLDKSAMQSRLNKIIKEVSIRLLTESFEINGDRYFSNLGAEWKKTVQVRLRETHEGVRKMRLSRGTSKCDGREGYRFRFDFFL